MAILMESSITANCLLEKIPGTFHSSPIALRDETPVRPSVRMAPQLLAIAVAGPADLSFKLSFIFCTALILSYFLLPAISRRIIKGICAKVDLGK